MVKNHSDAEPMQDFFEKRSGGYDDHMRSALPDFDAFYQALSKPIPRTGQEIRVLDLGGGTGFSLVPVFQQAPRAQVTVIDLSEKMLGQLRERHHERLSQIDIIRDSFLEVCFPEGMFDVIVSVMSLHHLPPGEKSDLYHKIFSWLAPGGKYVEGDYVVASIDEEESLSAYRRLMKRLKTAAPGLYHVDVPLSISTQCELLRGSGFDAVDVIWKQNEAAVIAAVKMPGDASP